MKGKTVGKLKKQLESCPSDLVLDIYILDKFDPRFAKVRTHVLYCDKCFNRVIQMEDFDKELTALSQ